MLSYNLTYRQLGIINKKLRIKKMNKPNYTLENKKVKSIKKKNITIEINEKETKPIFVVSKDGVIISDLVSLCGLHIGVKDEKDYMKKLVTLIQNNNVKKEDIVIISAFDRNFIQTLENAAITYQLLKKGTTSLF